MNTDDQLSILVLYNFFWGGGTFFSWRVKISSPNNILINLQWACKRLHCISEPFRFNGKRDAYTTQRQTNLLLFLYNDNNNEQHCTFDRWKCFTQKLFLWMKSPFPEYKIWSFFTRWGLNNLLKSSRSKSSSLASIAS